MEWVSELRRNNAVLRQPLTILAISRQWTLTENAAF